MNMNRRKTDPKPTEIVKPNIIISLLSAGFYVGLLVGGGLLFNFIIQQVNANWESRVAESSQSLISLPEEAMQELEADTFE